MDRVLVAGDEFGWGSAGILSGIARSLRMRAPGITMLGLDTKISRRVLASAGIEYWTDTDGWTDQELQDWAADNDVQHAVVVLNADLASRLCRAGIYVVYVDTLAFIWGEHDPLPTGVPIYCAQKFGAAELPRHSRLTGLPALKWVDGIVGAIPEPTRADSGRPLIAVGGLQSPASYPGSVDAYISTAVEPMLCALRDDGWGPVDIAGNTGSARASTLERLREKYDVSFLTLPREEFLERATAAPLLATSPGLTTLLEFGSLAKPTIVLPPQNLTHTWFSERVASICGTETVLSWGDRTLDADVLLELQRCKGEDVAVRMIYETIVRSSEDSDAFAYLKAAARSAIHAATVNPTAMLPFVCSIGSSGADQVAEMVTSSPAQYGTPR